MNIKKLQVLMMKGKIKDIQYYHYLKNQCNYKIIGEILSNIFQRKNRHYSHLFKNLLPKSYEEIRKSEIVFGENLKQELIWNFALFDFYVEEINSFLKYKNNFENQLISGEFDEARQSLEYIENNICCSTWTLEHRFVVEEKTGGIEKNKELLSHLSGSNTDFVVKCLAEFYSYKAESNTSAKQYFNKLSEYYEKLNYIDLYAFFRFKLSPIADLDEHDLLRVFTIDGASSIIDRYITTIRLCQLICMNDDKYSELQDLLNKCLKKISAKIDDPLIENILRYHDPVLISSDSVSNLSNITARVIELYTSGKYSNCLFYIRENFHLISNNFEIYPIMAKCCIYLNISDYKIGSEKSDFHSIVNYLKNIYFGKKDSLDLLNWLYKKAMSISFSSFYYGVLKFLNEEFDIKVNNEIQFMANMNSLFINPLFSDIYNNDEISSLFIDTYDQLLSKDCEVTETIILLKVKHGLEKINKDVISFKNLRLARYYAKSLITTGKSSDSATLLKEILQFTNQIRENQPEVAKFIYYQIQTDLYKAYLMDVNNLEDAMELFVTSYLENSFSTIKLNVKELIEKIKDNYPQLNKFNLAFPILYNIYFKSEYSEVYPVCADFLDEHRIGRPSQLVFEENAPYDKQMYIYFLRDVCKMEILDCLPEFNDAKEIFDERIKIIQNLISIDPKNVDDYVKELSQLTQQIKVNSMVTMLDESRIDINVKGLKNDPESFYKENYKRYVDVSKIIKPYIGINIDDLAKVYAYEDLDKLNRVKRDINDLSTLSFSLFREAIINIRNQFCFSKYGLDASLSTRIRHGSLKNEMRSPFESNKLVLSREDAESAYDFNAEWKNNLVGRSDLFSEKLRLALESISKEIDKKIEDINQNWLRVRTEEKNLQGLFNFSLDESSIRLIYKLVMDNNTIRNSEDFFDQIMLSMWDITYRSLEIIRKKFNEEVRNELIMYLDKFLDNITNIAFDPYEENVIREIEKKIIDCRLDVQHQMSKISNWFKISESAADGEFDADLLLDTLIATCETLNPAYKEINFKRNVDCPSTFLGTTFTYLIDIIRILYDNAVKHSEFRDYSKLTLEVTVEEDNDFIKFTMKNNWAEHILITDVKNEIEKTKNRLNEKDAVTRYTIEEGKSGYVKIAKIINYNLLAVPSVIIMNATEEREYVAKVFINKYFIINSKKGEELFEVTNS